MTWFSFHFNDFAISFLSVLFEGVPFLLLGALISGLVDVFVSAERITKLMPKKATDAILTSGLLGLVFPMCECGSVIIIRRFLRKGLPLSSAVTYMLAAPIVSPIVAFSTYAAFKGQSPELMTILRLALGFSIAATVGFIMHRLPSRMLLAPGALGQPTIRQRAGLSVAASPGVVAGPEGQDFASLAQSSSFGKKLLLAVQSATADFLDVAFFFIIGTAVTSVFNTAIDRSVIDAFATNPPMAIGSMMVLAALLALCSTTDAFIAATFGAFPFAAKLGFLLFGPMFDLKLFWLYSLVFRRRVVVLLALGLFVVIALICLQIDGLAL
jgi:uncharacterized protein